MKPNDSKNVKMVKPSDGNEIVFNSSPFFQRAYGVPSPLSSHQYIKNWVTEKYGIKAFILFEMANNWVYFLLPGNVCIQATPEFLDDTEPATLAFNKLLNYETK